MKYLIPIFMFFICLCGYSQSERELMNNFTKGENNIIYWQKVFETELNEAELLEAVLESGFFDDIELAGPKVVCVLRPYKINYEQYGYSLFETSTYLTQNLVTATVVFHFKNRRYRATVKNIKFIQNTEDGTGIVSSLEEQVLNRFQELKFSYFKNASEILDKDFTIKTNLKLDNKDW